jgi:transaldolase
MCSQTAQLGTGCGTGGAGALVERGRNIMRLFEELDVPKDKYLLRIPATWEGIQAAKTLEAEGAATHIIMVYRCLNLDAFEARMLALLESRRTLWAGCHLLATYMSARWAHTAVAISRRPYVHVAHGQGHCCCSCANQHRTDTDAVLLRSFVQAAAAAQAGVSVISPNVGRIGDFYQRNPGAIRNPKVHLLVVCTACRR